MYKFTKLNKGTVQGREALSIWDIDDWTNDMKLCAAFRKILFDDYFYGVYGSLGVSCSDLDSEGACFEFTRAVEDLVSGAGRNFWVVKKRVNRCGGGVNTDVRTDHVHEREYGAMFKNPQEPFEWVFAGFVYLYGFYGKSSRKADGGGVPLCSAYVGCCFKREFWGEDALKIGRKFINYCFSRLSIYKLKCETMRSNPYVGGFLKRLNFNLEGVLEDDTFVEGKPESLMLWGLTADNWTKKRTLRVPDYTSRSINNKIIVTDFSLRRKKD